MVLFFKGDDPCFPPKRNKNINIESLRAALTLLAWVPTACRAHTTDFGRCLGKMRTRQSLNLDLAFGNFKLLLFKDNNSHWNHSHPVLLHCSLWRNALKTCIQQMIIIDFILRWRSSCWSKWSVTYITKQARLLLDKFKFSVDFWLLLYFSFPLSVTLRTCPTWSQSSELLLQLIKIQQSRQGKWLLAGFSAVLVQGSSVYEKLHRKGAFPLKL